MCWIKPKVNPDGWLKTTCINCPSSFRKSRRVLTSNKFVYQSALALTSRTVRSKDDAPVKLDTGQLWPTVGMLLIGKVLKRSQRIDGLRFAGPTCTTGAYKTGAMCEPSEAIRKTE